MARGAIDIATTALRTYRYEPDRGDLRDVAEELFAMTLISEQPKRVRGHL